MSLCIHFPIQCVLNRSNSDCQLGQKDRTDTVVPKVIEDIIPMSAIACGSNHCLSLDSKGHVYMWGCGEALGRLRDVPRPRRVNLP
jgi:alpha-tubulin suppressor-like RCC1 family protein